MADDEPVPAFIKQSIKFPDGTFYNLTKALTNYRSCHDGTPKEARIVFICTSSSSTVEHIMKVKVQLPADKPSSTPSTTTAAEISALEKFAAAKTPYAPQLIAFHIEAQDESGPFPGGFLTYTVMTKLPGFALFGKYWNLSQSERDEIVPKAVEALRAIYELGIEPTDRGMRNVIWDQESKSCGIIDFELWNPINGTFGSEKAEMQRWGLIRTPPARDHYIAFNAMYR